MASTVAGRRATEEYRRTQIALSARVVAGMLSLWRLLDPEDLEGTFDGWLAAVMLFMPRHHDLATGLATRYYRRFRAAEFGSLFTGTLPAPGFDDESVRARMIWAGPGEMRRQQRLGKPLRLAAADAGAFVASYAQEIVADTGRETVTQAVQTDRVALGWQRFTDGSPCAFCAMLSSRGPVYKTETSASFEAHRRCGCGVEPVFSRDQEWPPGARDFKRLYDEHAKGHSDPLNAFRRAYEGRGDPDSP